MSGVVSEKPDLIPNLEGSANQSACRAGCRSSLELSGTPSGAEDEGREGSPRRIHLKIIPKYHFLMCEM
jgi:hypothetical protein